MNAQIDPETGSEEFNINGITAVEFQQYIQMNTPYYFNQWQGLFEKRTKDSWNWAAFCLGPIWYMARKMYGLSLMEIALMVIVQMALHVIMGNAWVAWIGSLGIVAWYAVKANHRFLMHALKQIKEIKAIEQSEAAYGQQLKKAGGANWVGAFVIIVVIPVMFHTIQNSLLIGNRPITPIKRLEMIELRNTTELTAGKKVSVLNVLCYWGGDDDPTPAELNQSAAAIVYYFMQQNGEALSSDPGNKIHININRLSYIGKIGVKTGFAFYNKTKTVPEWQQLMNQEQDYQSLIKIVVPQ